MSPNMTNKFIINIESTLLYRVRTRCEGEEMREVRERGAHIRARERDERVRYVRCERDMRDM